MKHEDDLVCSAWVAVVDKAGKEGRARSGTFLLPPAVSELVLSGMELGHANDKIFKLHNSKQGHGAVGSLTGMRCRIFNCCLCFCINFQGTSRNRMGGNGRRG